MVNGILGKKLGMTQIFDDDGNRIPVTVLEAGPCVVQDVRTAEKDGYNAVKLGFGETKESRLKKPQREELKRKKLKPMKFVSEIRCQDAPDVEVGAEITNKLLQKGDYLDVVGTTKGKGFQGGMKRHNWAGGKESHGSMSHRAPGSIGASAYPSRVIKGHPLPGHMGNETCTVQNLEVVDVDTGNNTISVKGAVPGANGGYLVMKFSKKKPIAPRQEEEKADQEGGEAAEEGKE